MSGRRREKVATRLVCASAALVGVVQAAVAAPSLVADLDLSAAFGTRSAWRFTAAQDPPAEDPFLPGETVPGRITLCLRRAASERCDTQVRSTLRAAAPDDMFSEPHYLDTARIVPGPAVSEQPLLLLQTASVHSGDGDQLVLTQVLAYGRDTDRFVRVYEHGTGRNNNQEVRYVEAGPLKGDIISVEPTGDAPFGFWVTVNALAPGQAYRQVLRYRSATHYGDGNPLAVIDSEMANIEQRLGVWHPGAPLPVPAGSCPRPHLTGMELWCG